MAQTQLYPRKSQLHIVPETTTDAYLAPAGTGANMVQVENLAYSITSEQFAPNYIRPDYLSSDESPGATQGQLTFEWPLRGSGTAGTAPQIANALKACGMSETTVASTSVTYKNVSTFDGAGGNPASSYSLSWLLNGVRFALKGAFGTWRLVGDVKTTGRLFFTFLGAYVAFAADALEAPTYQTTLAPRFNNNGLFSTNFGGVYVPKGVNNFELEQGNQIVIGMDVNDPTGIYGARITGRKSSGFFDCELVLPATKDFFAIREAGTAGTITTGVIGGTAGNQWQTSVNRATLRPIEVLGEVGNIARVRVPFGVSSLGTDVESTNPDVSLVFT